MHASNVAHLDIKPENVYATQRGVYKIGDFGLATVGDSDEHDDEGDKRYLSWELLQNDKCDLFKADVFVRAPPGPVAVACCLCLLSWALSLSVSVAVAVAVSVSVSVALLSVSLRAVPACHLRLPPSLSLYRDSLRSRKEWRFYSRALTPHPALTPWITGRRWG
eukprot:1021219-Rhodomonas_salina.1